jgi:hypothetical protein
MPRGKRQAASLHDARDKGHQGLGMTAPHRLLLLRDQFARVGVQHGGRACIQCGIDGKNQHFTSPARPVFHLTRKMGPGLLRF